MPENAPAPIPHLDKRALLRKAALEYHEFPKPGKVAIAATKQLVNQHDLALAYSPGVAAPCEEIVKDPAAAFRYTSRGNLVGVVTNGTAVLGLGDIGPLAGKPVMEGKGVLFKKFSGIDVFDIEINEKDPDKLVEIIAALEPTFGGINLEDIKAPDCFYVERKLRERMKIPVFHDDQHGTAIVVGAAILNGLKVAGKDPSKVKLVASGAGAAALACLGLLVKLGIQRENIWVTDLAGVVYEGRTELMDEDKQFFAQKTDQRTLSEVIAGADVFLGLSAGGVLKKDMVAKMAERPLIFALANPNPEIQPEDVQAVRDDAIMATGRSDYPNQVNNVLCFPYIFRGALDCGATTITLEMEIAAVHAIAGRLQPGTALDAAALSRGTSIYLPDRAIPMLPRELSSHLASLLENEDRLTLAVEVQLSAEGKIEKSRVIEGVMRCHASLSYQNVAWALGWSDLGTPNDEAMRLKGDLEVAQGHIKEGSAIFAKIAAAEPQNSMVRAKLVSLAIDSKDYTGAQTWLDELKKITGPASGTMHLQALNDFRQGKYPAARDAIQTAGRQMARFHQRYDVLLSATLAHPPEWNYAHRADSGNSKSWALETLKAPGITVELWDQIPAADARALGAAAADALIEYFGQ